VLWNVTRSLRNYDHLIVMVIIEITSNPAMLSLFHSVGARATREGMSRLRGESLLVPIWNDLKQYLDRYFYMSNSDEDVAAIRFIQDPFLPFAILFNIVQSYQPSTSSSSSSSSTSSSASSETKGASPTTVPTGGDTTQHHPQHAHPLTYTDRVHNRLCDICSDALHQAWQCIACEFDL
jgi:hypothetical protein